MQNNCSLKTFCNSKRFWVVLGIDIQYQWILSCMIIHISIYVQGLFYDYPCFRICSNNKTMIIDFPWASMWGQLAYFQIVFVNRIMCHSFQWKICQYYGYKILFSISTLSIRKTAVVAKSGLLLCVKLTRNTSRRECFSHHPGRPNMQILKEP